MRAWRSTIRWRVLPTLLAALLASCASPLPVARSDAKQGLDAFEQRRLDAPELGLPATQPWDRAQWFRFAQARSPALAEARARLALVKAGELTAAQRPNPTLNLTTEYIAAAAASPAWLFGVAVDFLLQSPGSLDRAKAVAALQSDAAGVDLGDALWQLRSGVQAALLDAVAAQSEAQRLDQLIGQRTALLTTARRFVTEGESPATDGLRAEAELAAAVQRRQQAGQRQRDARQRLATAVGVPMAALAEVPLSWPDWSQPDRLVPLQHPPERDAALLARPELLRALRETELAELGIQAELGKRRPEVRVSPGYTDDHGVRKNQLGIGIPLPLFNRNEGPIAEAQARRDLAARHVEVVQADLLAQIDGAERTWPVALGNWRAAAADESRLLKIAAAERTRLSEGASDRPSLLAAEIAVTEAELSTLTAALDAQKAFAALEDAYRTPLTGPESGAARDHAAIETNHE